MHFLNSKFFFALVFITLSELAYGQTKPENIPESTGLKSYIWSFASREGERTQLTQNFTTEFEEILVQSNIITVLNRTRFAKVLEQRNLEKSIQEISDLPDSTINTLKIIKADLVIFGEIYEEKQSNLARITITFQNFDSEIVVKVSQDAVLSKINSSIVYRETQIKNLINKIDKSINGKSKKKFNKILSRNTYKKGFGIDIYPYVFEFLEPGIRLSFQSEKRWGAGVGILTEHLDGVYIWAGASYDCFNRINEEWGLLVGPNIGIADFRDFFGFVDAKFRYKIFTTSFGIGFNNDIGEMILPVSFGLHFPID